MTTPIKPFWPTLANLVNKSCRFITKHQTVLIAVITAIDPSQESDVLAAFTALSGACTLFLQVMAKVDPNWKPS